VTDFIFLGFKITADGDCRREVRWSDIPVSFRISHSLL